MALQADVADRDREQRPAPDRTGYVTLPDDDPPDISPREEAGRRAVTEWSAAQSDASLICPEGDPPAKHEGEGDQPEVAEDHNDQHADDQRHGQQCADEDDRNVTCDRPSDKWRPLITRFIRCGLGKHGQIMASRPDLGNRQTEGIWHRSGPEPSRSRPGPPRSRRGQPTGARVWPARHEASARVPAGRRQT
ncbi:MAG: hypothetical protein JWO57_475 [Pseudonocardiales bacterium]|nr:hypothetical protein [Pseudonocardiales bacterium]